jgi:hypothetical protein
MVESCLSHGWTSLGACNQVNNSLYVSIDYDIACIRSSDDQSDVQGVIRKTVMRDLSLWRACLEEEGYVSIHIYLQDIILMKR